jgi:hypothetical protein
MKIRSIGFSLGSWFSKAATAILVTGLLPFMAATPSGEASSLVQEVKPLLELRVKGRLLLDANDKEVWLQGVNVVSLEFRLHGEHVNDAIRVAIEDWKANAIRLPVKDSYWFGKEKGQADGGAAYRKLVDEAVEQVISRGAYLILDLHRFGAVRAEHVEFWKDAATHFKNHPGILFDIFNETHSTSWEVWRNGGWVDERKHKADEDAFLAASEQEKAKQGFESPGMQKLVEAVRSVGAKNVIIAGGLDWAYDLSGIVNGYALNDPSGNGIMYSTHIYNWKRDWAGKVMGAAALYPIFVGEVGADVNKMSFIPAELQEDPYTWVPDMLGLIQKERFHWTGWSFHPRTTPVMISNWDFVPTPFWGAFAKAALAGKRFEMTRMR